MTGDRAFIDENDRERRRLADLVTRLSDDDLSRPMEAGWTVASVLLHMAFWDYRIVTMLDRWRPDGWNETPTYDERAVHWINDTTKAIFLDVPPRVAAAIAVTAAEMTDSAVADLSDEVLARNEALGNVLNPYRSEHRGEHLDELEAMFPGG